MLLVEYMTSYIAPGKRSVSSARSVASSSRSACQQRSNLAKQRRVMTRSAPPERNVQARLTSGTGRHTTHTRSRNGSSVKDTPSISIEDIYQFAERERLNYSSCSRRQNLAHAQSQTSFFRHEQVIVSRPNTSASTNRNINSSRRETNTPMSAWSEPLVSRPSSIIPHPELRDLLETADEEEDSDAEDYDDYHLDMAAQTPMTVTFSPGNVSRDCCEIMGPQLCYECRKNRIRAASKHRSDAYFPMLEPSEDNLTTAAIVRKYLPGLSEPEIETKLARGEIAKPSIIRKQNRHVEFDDEEPDVKPRHTNKKVTIAEYSKEKKENSSLMTQNKPNELFFTNIRDLNNKIITGNVERNVGFSKAVKAVMAKKETHVYKSHFPTFVSPKKVEMVKETNYKTYFDPPLIEKAKQDVEPAFFAGSKQEYVLPEKLPDELVFVDKDGNSVKATSADGFTNKMSVSEEAKGKKSNLVKVEDSSPAEHLTILKEDEEETEETAEAPLDKIKESEEESDDDLRSFLSTSDSSELLEQTKEQSITKTDDGNIDKSCETDSQSTH